MSESFHRSICKRLRDWRNPVETLENPDIYAGKQADLAVFSVMIWVDIGKKLCMETRKVRIGAAKHHANPLSWMRLVNAGKQRCEGRGAAGFRN
jgi:hypothetical protein